MIATAHSGEVQQKAVRNGRVPAIHNPELNKEYGADKNNPAPVPERGMPSMERPAPLSCVSLQLAALRL
ncbi:MULTISPECIES: hypothetical protein [Paenibacillus]|uniref:hypothetical protein n=1 Tax=Paenibacillus TaxID=44249 RepID=UPI0022B8D6F9|nr:hypothetical protein [Paenibacillus caseinilyticus]MCZ8521658.1 hypothetical protein [Paenibacillus caseinilyticus]